MPDRNRDCRGPQPANVVVDAIVSLAAGVVFGLALAAPPGPMNAVIAEESVVRGWPAGFRAGLGAMSADIVFLVLALAGIVTIVERYPGLRGAMVTVGGVLMLYFAVDAARSTGATLAGEDTGGGRGFSKAFTLALTNPYQILFWLTVGIGLLDPGQLDVFARLPAVGDALAGTLVVQTGSVALIAGLFGGVLAWILAFPAALVAASRRVEAAVPAVAALSALVLAGFGVLFLWDGLATLL
jgi:Putative threonine efflux protein